MQLRSAGHRLLFIVALLATPLAAEAQAPQKVPSVGDLPIGSASDPRRIALFGVRVVLTLN